MARFSSILIPADLADIKIAGLAALTSSAEQNIGKNRVFVINSTKDISIRFGLTGMGAADATFYRIPANQQTTFDMGQAHTHIRVFNQDGAAAADVYIKFLSTL